MSKGMSKRKGNTHLKVLDCSSQAIKHMKIFNRHGEMEINEHWRRHFYSVK